LVVSARAIDFLERLVSEVTCYVWSETHSLSDSLSSL